MKNLVVAASVLSSLTLLNACGKADKSAEQEQSALASDDKPTLGGIDFNLGKHLLQSGVKSSDYVNVDEMGVSIGAKTNFLAQNNFTVVSKTQKITAQYYTDLTILEKRVPGHSIDLSAVAKSDKIEAEVNFRILGQSLYSLKSKSEVSYSFARDIGITIPYPILPALSVDLGGKVGGEVGFTVAPGLSEDNQSLQSTVEPASKLFGKVEAGVSVVFARAEAQGTVNIMEAVMPVLASVGEKSQVDVKALEITTLSGGADLIASLSLGNVLPAPAAKIWKQVFGKGIEYTYPLIRYEGIPALKTAPQKYSL